jgi:hypothetical protein
VALFNFTGHGIQYKGLNWLIPIGANVQRESDIEFEAINAERVLTEMQGGSSGRVNIVIFDACRTNPNFRSFTKSSNRGFAYPKAQPEGSIVAFSTAPGTVAYDGDGRYSPYVTELSKHMLTPGLKIEDVFKRVRIGVKNRTSRKPSPQIPWENSSLMGDFYFVLPQGGEPSSAKVSADERMWNLIEFSKDPTEFESFLRAFPNSQFTPIARLKLKRLKVSEKEAEQQAKKSSCYPDTSLQYFKDTNGRYGEPDKEILTRFIERWCPDDPVAEKRLRNKYEKQFEEKNKLWNELYKKFGIKSIKCKDKWQECMDVGRDGTGGSGPECFLELDICEFRYE